MPCGNLPYDLAMVDQNLPELARVEFRMAQNLKSEVEEAASLLGLTLTAFASQVLVERARQVKQEATKVRLNDEERDAFLHMLGSPPQVNEALRKTLSTNVQL